MRNSKFSKKKLLYSTTTLNNLMHSKDSLLIEKAYIQILTRKLLSENSNAVYLSNIQYDGGQYRVKISLLNPEDLTDTIAACKDGGFENFYIYRGSDGSLLPLNARRDPDFVSKAAQALTNKCTAEIQIDEDEDIIIGDINTVGRVLRSEEPHRPNQSPLELSQAELTECMNRLQKSGVVQFELTRDYSNHERTFNFKQQTEPTPFL